MKKYIVQLTDEQRQALKQLLSSGVTPARKLMHAQILLKADSSQAGPAWSDEQIQQTFEVGLSTVERVRKRFVEQGLDAALTRCLQPERPEKRKVTGEQEAHVLALTCSQPPSGHKRWTMRLLADTMVAFGYSEHISHKTVWVT